MNKILLMSLALIVCLTVTGVTYAVWTEGIVVQGTVESGNFRIRFTSASGDLREGDYKPQVSIVDDRHISISVSKAELGYSGVVNAVVTNESSVPVRVTVDTDYGPGAQNAIKITLKSPSSFTLAKGQSATVTLGIDVVADCPGVYVFGVTCRAEQWNLGF